MLVGAGALVLLLLVGTVVITMAVTGDDESSIGTDPGPSTTQVVSSSPSTAPDGSGASTSPSSTAPVSVVSTTVAPTYGTAPSPASPSSSGGCSIITSTVVKEYLDTAPSCLDYQASGGSVPTSSITEGWLTLWSSAQMVDAGANTRAMDQLDAAQAVFPDAVLVDSRLYRGLRDANWAVVIPAYSEDDARSRCPAVPEPSGCVARHTDITLDELRAGVRP
jgi:hypothetical protein